MEFLSGNLEEEEKEEERSSKYLQAHELNRAKNIIASKIVLNYQLILVVVVVVVVVVAKKKGDIEISYASA